MQKNKISCFRIFVIFLLTFSFKAPHLFGQTIVYCFPGQGANGSLFDSLQIDSKQFKKQVIEYDKFVSGKCSIKSIALDISNLIDTNSNFVLIGTSLGGMICVELSEILKPQHTIIISSAKNRSELPFRYKFQKTLPINLLIPGIILKKAAIILQPLVEPDAKKHELFFRKMVNSKSSAYMKNSVRAILQWKRKSNNSNIIHIHGDHDRTIPIRNIKKVDYQIGGGSHMMTYTKANEISILIQNILRQ